MLPGWPPMRTRMAPSVLMNRRAISPPYESPNRPLANDAVLTQPIFIENCKAGYFDTVSAEAGAPFEGANSFTEGQAQDRILAAGFGNVSALTKDDKGIWRGTADSQGKKVNVAVDYKGNVVTTDM